mmetsp:Transcript_117456/g.365092  ORF Transcript_117456/g.365092 Transcript_117456/m.365092 type:complete len:347 (-) Transcript_117456:534-1574(-)
MGNSRGCITHWGKPCGSHCSCHGLHESTLRGDGGGYRCLAPWGHTSCYCRQRVSLRWHKNTLGGDWLSLLDCVTPREGSRHHGEPLLCLRQGGNGGGSRDQCCDRGHASDHRRVARGRHDLLQHRRALGNQEFLRAGSLRARCLGHQRHTLGPKHLLLQCDALPALELGGHSRVGRGHRWQRGGRHHRGHLHGRQGRARWNRHRGHRCHHHRWPLLRQVRAAHCCKDLLRGLHGGGLLHQGQALLRLQSVGLCALEGPLHGRATLLHTFLADLFHTFSVLHGPLGDLVKHLLVLVVRLLADHFDVLHLRHLKLHFPLEHLGYVDDLFHHLSLHLWHGLFVVLSVRR